MICKLALARSHIWDGKLVFADVYLHCRKSPKSTRNVTTHLRWFSFNFLFIFPSEKFSVASSGTRSETQNCEKPGPGRTSMSPCRDVLGNTRVVHPSRAKPLQIMIFRICNFVGFKLRLGVDAIAISLFTSFQQKCLWCPDTCSLCHENRLNGLSMESVSSRLIKNFPVALISPVFKVSGGWFTGARGRQSCGRVELFREP